jgi:hypothetical protein
VQKTEFFRKLMMMVRKVTACMIKDMEICGNNVTNKAEVRKKYEKLMQDQKLGVIMRVAWSPLQKFIIKICNQGVCYDS